MSRLVEASNTQISRPATHGEDEDSVAEDEPVTATAELPGQIAVLAEDRGQNREAVEGGVRGQDQDACGEALHQQEPDRRVAKDGPGDLR